MIVAAVLLGRGAMSFRSLLMVFGGLLVRILRHNMSLLFERSPRQPPEATDGSNVRSLATYVEARTSTVRRSTMTISLTYR
jgi:hypothetical protein